MKVATAAEIRQLDREAIDTLGIPGIVLMEKMPDYRWYR